MTERPKKFKRVYEASKPRQTRVNRLKAAGMLFSLGRGRNGSWRLPLDWGKKRKARMKIQKASRKENR